MKKLVIGLIALGAVIALRPLAKRRMVQTMHAHCRQMAGKCRQMMGAHAEGRAEASRMREHCGPAAVPDEEPSEPVAAV